MLTASWVDATPFRAHLRFLMGVGALTVSDVAALAGVSATAATHLLRGRDGRTVRRISPEMARRLITVTATDVRGLAWRLVPTDKARGYLRRLRDLGCSDAEILQLTRLSAQELAGLARSGECSQLITIRLAAAVEESETQAGPRRRSAALPVAA
ncbi:MAG TPA: hypothetical protein VIT20_01140 [Propionibacteriaceae bacterium]